jgi:hypothetical protein
MTAVGAKRNFALVECRPYVRRWWEFPACRGADSVMKFLV